jgi:hypothetical protein
MPEINEVDKEALTAALVVLQRKGVPSDTLEMLTHGDGRGTIAPGALNEAIRAALRAPSPIGLADEEVEGLAVVLKTTLDGLPFSDEATPGRTEMDQYRTMARAVLTHLRAQRKASDAGDTAGQNQSGLAALLDQWSKEDHGSEGADSEQPEPVRFRELSLQTCAAESVPEGWAWKVVPEEATAQMWQAGRSADEHPGDSYCAVWRAMYAASPSPPELHRESQPIGGK